VEDLHKKEIIADNSDNRPRDGDDCEIGKRDTLHFFKEHPECNGDTDRCNRPSDIYGRHDEEKDDTKHISNTPENKSPSERLREKRVCIHI